MQSETRREKYRTELSTPIQDTEYEYRIQNPCQTVLGEREFTKSCQYGLARVSYSVFVFRILYWDEGRACAKLYWIDLNTSVSYTHLTLPTTPYV